MIRYVVVCREYSDQWAWTIRVFDADRFTKRHYKEVLRGMQDRLNVNPKGSYAIVYRGGTGSAPKKVLEIDVLTYISNWPEITAMVLCNGHIMREFFMAE